MAEPKWTKGPWRANKNRAITAGDATIGNACQSFGVTANGSFHVTEKDAEANANLIAAAPDLYKALDRCLNFIANTESEMGETLESGDVARAALAKARGEQ
jgi:hypothetical protein